MFGCAKSGELPKSSAAFALELANVPNGRTMDDLLPVAGELERVRFVMGVSEKVGN